MDRTAVADRRTAERLAQWSDRWGPLAIVLGSITLTALWILRDRVAPAWDQSHYLWLADQYVSALENRGIRDFASALYDLDPSRAPLFSLLLVPVTLVTGPGPRGALVLNLLLWPILLFAVYRVATRLFDRRAGLLAMVITATIPIIVGLSHEVLADFLLCALAVATVALLLETDYFQRPAVSALVGLVAGIGFWAKVTFIAFVVGPVAVVGAMTLRAAWREIRTAEDPSSGRARLRNMTMATGICVLIAALWYVPNFSETRAYVTSTTSGELTLGAGPDDPLDPGTMARFALGMVNNHLSWVVVTVGLACAVGVAVKWWRKSRAGSVRSDVVRAALLAGWVAIPYLSVSTSNNQDVRLMAPAFPAVAVVVAGLATSIRQDRARRAAVAVLVVGGLLQTSLLTVRWSVPLLPDHLIVGTPVGDAVLHLDSDPLGYNRLPGWRDDASPVVGALEEISRRADGSLQPLRVGVLQPHRAINPNTLRYLAGVRHDPFTFADVRGSQSDLAALRATLQEFDAILYIPPPPRPPDPEQDRLYLLTELSASAVITPEMLDLFPAHRQTYELLDGRRLLLAARSPLSAQSPMEEP